MKKYELNVQKVTRHKRNMLSSILPDVIIDLALVAGLAAIVTCILFGLEGKDNDQT